MTAQSGIFFSGNHLIGNPAGDIRIRLIGKTCRSISDKGQPIKSCMQKSSCTPNIVKNSLKMLIYFHGNSAFSPVFASLWDTT
ncbi:MAG: hypothetical protein BECKG1743D_GA0114223_101993 [Candidatus Kentron sp. G]|nr:MAG: hypothetical protein BECKG1743E_GA0114224_100333 [Candidatus Kentron sp. G]VFM96553.1 MAG: hypothetical protein BECKG1743F_GA0114225_101693 [Candidatus Kentron sp. G]VFN00483.1 MAG: hypothetical protein BECKG1743D_GA0114223_101993 [Candidatus Kentron sp. G]